MRKYVFVSFLCMLILVGCGPESGAGNNDISENNTQTVTSDNVPVEPGMEMFAEFPDEFSLVYENRYSIIDIWLQDNGTFTGYYEMYTDETGPEYPNGTRYICDFNGKFSAPVQKSEYVYTTKITELNISSRDERIEYEMRFPKTTEIEELQEGDEITIYLHDAMRSELSQSFLSSLDSTLMGPELLKCYGLCDENTGVILVGQNFVAMEELSKLEGSYVNDMGDKLVIDLSDPLGPNDMRLGDATWMPHDGEAGNGSARKNAKGGITITLDESMTLNFKLHYDDEGNMVGIVGVDWQEDLGILIKEQ